MILAESLTEAAQSWPAAATVALTMAGGWVTLLIRQRGEGKKLTEVKDQVTNGGTNLAATVADVKTLLTDQGSDIRGIRKDIGDLRGELRDERHARIDLQQAVEKITRDA